MNDGMRSSGLVCISTNTFSDVDIFIYKMFTFRFPDRAASLAEHSYFFAKNNISIQLIQLKYCFLRAIWH